MINLRKRIYRRARGSAVNDWKIKIYSYYLRRGDNSGYDETFELFNLPTGEGHMVKHCNEICLNLS